MKKLSLIFISILLFSCQNKTVQKERMIGFHPNKAAQDLGWHLGTQAAIDVVIALDKAWAANDYASMKEMFVDTLSITVPEGKVFRNFEDFQAYEQAQGEASWEFLYAYSVDINPAIGGEHVQAGFSINSTDEQGQPVKKQYHESYYVVNGKIVSLNQYGQRVLE